MCVILLVQGCLNRLWECVTVAITHTETDTPEIETDTHRHTERQRHIRSRKARTGAQTHRQIHRDTDS